MAVSFKRFILERCHVLLFDSNLWDGLTTLLKRPPDAWCLRVAPYLIGKMVVPLRWYPSCLTPQGALSKGIYRDIPNKYPLYKVYMGLIIKGTIPRVPPFSLWISLASFSADSTDCKLHSANLPAKKGCSSSFAHDFSKPKSGVWKISPPHKGWHWHIQEMFNNLDISFGLTF